MVVYYLDTSALLKRYLCEIGSHWLRQTLNVPEITIITAEIAMVETVSAFNRRVREGTVTIVDYNRFIEQFQNDCRDVYDVVVLDAKIISLAWRLLERFPLRSYDSVHLATALITDQKLAKLGEFSLTFLSADSRLNKAAQTEGLTVDDPNQYS
jgi:hypothetical protein